MTDSLKPQNDHERSLKGTPAHQSCGIHRVDRNRAITSTTATRKLPKYALVDPNFLWPLSLFIPPAEVMKLEAAILFTFLLVGLCRGAEKPPENTQDSSLDPELRDVLGDNDKTKNATDSNSSATNSTSSTEPPPSSINSTASTTEKAKKAEDDDEPNLG